MKKHEHTVLTEQVGSTHWLAYDKDPALIGSKVARGITEDIAVAQWWALYGSLDEKYPRKDWKEYVSHEVVQGEA